MWFRSDLRTQDNPALYAAAKENSVIIRGIFYVTIKQWQQHDWGANKIGFVLNNVLALQQDLAKLNIALEIRYCDTFADLIEDLNQYVQSINVNNIYYNHEYELNESLRDRAIEKNMRQIGITIHGFHHQCLLPPGSIMSQQKTPYTVFTPFKKTCYQALYDKPIKLISEPKKQTQQDLLLVSDDELMTKYKDILSNPILKQWPCEKNKVAQHLTKFCNDKIAIYQEQRDIPSLDGTSSLSPYLATGRISVQQCFVAALHSNDNEFASGNANVMCWVSELLWRDFYKHIIYHFPNICKGQNFNHKYDKLKWLQPNNNLVLWQQGKTGFPIIDAAMRQLVTTGWMHNRLRMIVAMFLTKNLLIDWRHGEKFFSKHLVDLDFSSNNGGWQWSASTGTDAAPYFRIFNPVTQSERFDATGAFIKQYIPELIGLNVKHIHNPSTYLESLDLALLNYPLAIVDLSSTRLRAIEYFKNI